MLHPTNTVTAINPYRRAAGLVTATTIACALLGAQARAVDIVFDGSRTLIAGSECSAGARYRLGTSSSYGGKDLDVIAEITASDNDFTSQTINGITYRCVGVFEDDPGDPELLSVVGSDGSDNGDSTEAWSTDLRLTVVEKGTETPVKVDRLLLTVFDLDIKPNRTGADNVFVTDPAAIYLDTGSEVSYSKTSLPGPTGVSYAHHLAGTTARDCTPETQPECSAAVAVTNTTGLSLRVLNGKSDPTTPRLFQFSLTASDFDAMDLGNDSGDAPLSHGVANAAIASAPLLGAGLPPDTDGNTQASDDALGDDNDSDKPNDFDDDDGVMRNGADLAGQSLAIGSPETLEVTVFGTGRLNAFFDWNRDGDFDDAGEQAIEELELTTGRHSITVTPPATASSGESHARFRYCTAANDCNVPSGQASDGETEDYRIVLATGDARSGANTLDNGKIKTGLDGGGSLGWLTLLALPGAWRRRQG